VAGYWEKVGIPIKEQHRTDQPHAVIELVAAGAGFALVPLPVQEYAGQRIVYRRLDPALPQLELTLARARGMESPTINALLEMALQITRRQRHFFAGEGRATSHPSLSDFSAAEGSREQKRQAGLPPNGVGQLSATSSLLRARQPTRDGGRKSIA
jgi:hypothetical protein